MSKERLRIVQIIPSLGVGGAEQMACHLMVGLSKSHEVTAVSLYPATHSPLERRLEQNNISLRCLDKRPGFDPRMYPALDRVLGETRPHVVHTHLGILRYLFPVLLRRRVPVVVHTLHNMAEFESDTIGRFIQRFAFRKSVVPVAISQNGASSFRRLYGRECRAIIPNGIPLHAYRRGPEDRLLWRKSKPFAPDAVLFTCVGRLVPQKNPELLIHAFAGVRHERAHLVMLGEGCLGPQLQAAIQAHGLEHRIHLLGKRNEVAECLAASDVFVLSSAWEGNPLAVMEAMAAGLPVVSTAVGGVPELVEDGVHGIMTPAGEREALTFAMQSLLDDPRKRAAMGNAAYSRAAAEFGLDKMIQGYENVYRSALTESKPAFALAPSRTRSPSTGRLRIVYVTASLPHGTDEAFIVPEILELRRAGHDVLVVPRSPRGRILHGQALLEQTQREPLYSTAVLKAAAASTLADPTRIAGCTKSVFQGASLLAKFKNAAVVPKALWLADFAARWKADHLHCHWAGTTASMTMLASQISGIPWSFTAHRWDIVENNLLTEKVRSASFARFISQDGLTMARAIGIGPETNAGVVPMGVVIPELSRRYSQPRPVVICPARLVEVKGHRHLLEAWRMLAERGVEGELWLAGNGELRSALDAQVKASGLDGSVRFLGTIPHDALLKLYAEVEIAAVVLASIDMGHGLHEGIPVALIEAMSFGIPVVATMTGGTPELVQPGSGLLVRPAQPAALAGALQVLLQDDALRERLGAAGRLRVREEYDIVKVASQLAHAFEAARPRPAETERETQTHAGI